MTDGFIPPHGNDKDLLSYQKSLIVYDATVCFCERFFEKFDRTAGQMEQAARSGKQNIIEGNMASRLRKKELITGTRKNNPEYKSYRSISPI